MSIVTQDNRLGAKKYEKLSISRQEKYMIVPRLDNKTKRAIGKGFNAKEIHRSKERRPIFSLNVAEEHSGSSTPVHAFPLSFSLSQFLFFCFAVPNAWCSLRIIKVVANLDWRELRIHSLVSARGNWCLQLQRNFDGLFNWERRCARCRKWKSTLRATDMLKISLKRWKENHSFAFRQPH